MENSNILITGATGFLGSNLSKALLENGYKISILKRGSSNMFRLADILEKISVFNINEMSIEECLKVARPDIVVHCATDYGRKYVEPTSIIEANLILPLKLLELCRKYNIKSFINTDTFLDKGINYYSLSKKQFKDWLDTYSSELICINIILEHFYGPFDDRTKFVSLVIDKFLSGSDEVDLTEGRQKRDFIFIKDVISAFVCIIKNVPAMSKGFYNFGIGTNNQIEIRELVELIRKITGNTTTKLNFGSLPYRKNEIMESNVNTTAVRELGWKIEYSLIEGLKETIESEIEKKR